MTHCPDCELHHHQEIHPTVRVEYGDQTADIDVKIAPVILEMWKRGIHTLFSCQDHGESMNVPADYGWASIQMEPQELCKFLDMVRVSTEVLGLPPSPMLPFPFFSWKWDVYPVLMQQEDGADKTILMTSVIFPLKHTDIIISLLQRN